MATRTYTLGGGGLNRRGASGAFTAQDAHNFEVSVQKFVAALRLNFGKVLAATAVELRNRIMKGNPVDTGRSRDSWQLTIGAPSTYVPPQPWGREKNWPPPPPAAALEKIIDGTQPVFITTNVGYVEALENGWSRQAPFGFIRLAAEGISAELDGLTRRALAGETFK